MHLILPQRRSPYAVGCPRPRADAMPNLRFLLLSVPKPFT